MDTKAGERGFTLVEALATVLIFGILAAIAAPSYYGFLNRQRLDAAQSSALLVLREAQTTAKQQGAEYEACFRMFPTPTADDRQLQVSVAQVVSAANSDRCRNAAWRPIGDDPAVASAVELFDTGGSGYFTSNGLGAFSFQFDERGASAEGATGGVVTLTTRDNPGGIIQCVRMTGLLGTARLGQGPGPSGNGGCG